MFSEQCARQDAEAQTPSELPVTVLAYWVVRSTSKSPPLVGAEVIAGSTRLKAGTATKMVLNMISTGAMVRIGKTLGNRMVDLMPSNEKLRIRSRRILRELTGDR